MIFTDSQVNKLVLNRNPVCKSIINPESTHRVISQKYSARQGLIINFYSTAKKKK